MRTILSRSGLVLATVFLSAVPALAFDIELDLNPKLAAGAMTVEKPTPGRNFVEHVASYLRVIPTKGNRVAPAFINTHNYLTCPNDKTKKWYLNDVKQVSFDSRSGVTILGFFFDNPGCDDPTFHMEPIIGET